MDRAGYRALGAGKTFHNNAQPKDYDHARSWTEPYIPYDKHGELGNFFPLCLARDHTYYRCPIAARDEKELVDRKTVDAFVPQLRALAANASAPFFAMVGLLQASHAVDVSVGVVRRRRGRRRVRAAGARGGLAVPLQECAHRRLADRDGALANAPWWKCLVLWRCGADDDGSSADESEERRRRRLAKDDGSGEDASSWQRLALGDGIITSDRVATRYSKHRPMDRGAALVLRRAYRACVHGPTISSARCSARWKPTPSRRTTRSSSSHRIMATR